MVKLYCSHPLLDDTCLFAIVSYRREDGPQGLEAHRYVQQMSGKEEVIVMPQNRHGGVPDQVEVRLEMKDKTLLSRNRIIFLTFSNLNRTHVVRHHHPHFPDVVLGIN